MREAIEGRAETEEALEHIREEERPAKASVVLRLRHGSLADGEADALDRKWLTTTAMLGELTDQVAEFILPMCAAAWTEQGLVRLQLPDADDARKMAVGAAVDLCAAFVASPE